MQSSSEETQNSNGNGGCGSGFTPQPCACCAALAQLRMPWMDAAMQHAAPHYNYLHNQNHTADTAAKTQAESQHPESEPVKDDEKNSKTVFFKLPEFGKSKKQHKRSGSKKESRSISRFLSRNIGSNDCDNEAGEKFLDDGEIQEQAEAGLDSEILKGAETGDDPANTAGADEADWFKPKKEKFKLSFGLQGLAVGILGIFLPAFVLCASILSTPKRITLVMLHHPLESTIELLLVAAIPVVNFLVWSAICKQRANLSRWLVMGLGSSIGSALMIAAVSFAALFFNHDELLDSIGSDFSMGFTWLAFLSLLSAAVSTYLANRLRLSWELESSRLKVTVQAISGMVLAMLALVAAEYRPFCVRLAQYNAVSRDEKVQKEGIAWLRQINPEREMRMECSDNRAAGLAGLFFPIKSSVQHQLYFKLTGTPYSFRDEKSTDLASMPDDYLSRHVVGDRVPKLELTRSSLNGVLHANTLTSTLNWTFVIKNGNSFDQEMRAEIGLPAGAAISGLSIWRKGEAEAAGFVASGKVETAQTSTYGNTAPGMITDLGRGRVLLHCYPVPHEDELKVNLTMVVPLKSESAGQTSLVTPQLIATNFGLDGEHQLRLRSKNLLASSVKGLESSVNPSGDNVISGTLTSEQLETSPLLVRASRDQISKPYAVLDEIATKHKLEDEKEKERLRVERERAKERQRIAEARSENEELGKVVLMIDGSKGVSSQVGDLGKLLAKHKQDQKARVIKPRLVKVQPQYVVEELSRVQAPAPKHLLVVLDASASMEKYKNEIKSALQSLPASIKTSVIVASESNEKASKAKSVQETLSDFDQIQFIGGQDNLKAVVRASELAGENKDAAVLWIHGPQSVINREIYIMSAYEATPSFYELPVIAGTDTFEFFKNHSEIGPFVQVPRNGKSVADDLTEFFSTWNPNNKSLVAKLSQRENLNADYLKANKDEAHELLLLRAFNESNRLINTRHYKRAARLALAYGFVSPVSSALLGGTNSQPQDADNNSEATATNEAAPEAAPESSSESSADGYSNSSQQAILQGATNGTVGGDATVIMGVNTAGTVRVNNLANLEALLNIIANLGELGAIIAGVGLIAHGVMNKVVLKLGEDIELGPGGRMVLGGILITMGLMLPGIINWFVASARDANLFS